MEVEIVQLGFEHLRQVLDLGYELYDVTVKPYTSWSLSAVAEHVDSGDGACWVALDGEALVGFVLGSTTFELRDDWAYLEWIAVHPDYQGQGIAGRLIEACCAALFAAGAARVVTDVEGSNAASAALMRRNGFVPAVTVTLFERSHPAAHDAGAKPHGLPRRPLVRSGRLTGERRNTRDVP